MLEYNVDFIGGDFNMSAFSTVSDLSSRINRVFSTWSIRVCGDSVRWMSSIVSALVSSSCPSAHMNGVFDSHGCYKFDKAALGLGPRDQTAHLPVFLAPTASCAVSKRNKEGLTANITKWLSVPRLRRP